MCGFSGKQSPAKCGKDGKMLLFEALKIRIFAMPENAHGLS